MPLWDHLRVKLKGALCSFGEEISVIDSVLRKACLFSYGEFLSLSFLVINVANIKILPSSTGSSSNAL